MEEIAGHEVAAGLEQLWAGLARVREGSQRAYALSDGACRDAVESGVRLLAAMHAAVLGLVKDLDGRPEAHLSIDGTAMGTLKATLTPADTA